MRRGLALLTIFLAALTFWLFGIPTLAVHAELEEASVPAVETPYYRFAIEEIRSTPLPKNTANRLGPDDGQWQDHPAWDLVVDGDLASALRWFDRDLATLDDSRRHSEFGDGLSLGWSVTAATLACDILREMVVRGSDTEVRQRARKLLQLLYQEDGHAAQSWRESGHQPWQEAMTRLVKIHKTPQREILFHTPQLAIGPDGTQFRWQRCLWSGTSDRSRKPTSFGLIVAPPGRNAFFCSPPWQYRFPLCNLALTPDGGRLFLALQRSRMEPGTIVGLDTRGLMAGELKPRWEFSVPRPASLRFGRNAEQEELAIAVSADGKRLVWGGAYSGLGVLDTETGLPIEGALGDHAELRAGTPWEDGFEVFTRGVGSATATSSDGSRIYLPIRAKRHKPRPAVTLPGGGMFLPDPADFHMCGWVELNSSSCEIVGFRRNLWAPPVPHDALTPSTRWDYGHTFPDWCSSLPKGKDFCRTFDGFVILADLKAMSIVGVSDNWRVQRGAFKPKGTAIQWRYSFDTPIHILLSKPEFDRVVVIEDLLTGATRSPNHTACAKFGVVL